jgi:tetratricopeptide (TPR) repeat protein
VKRFYLAFTWTAFSLNFFIISLAVAAEEPFPPKPQTQPSAEKKTENPNFEKGFQLYNQSKYDEAIPLFEQVLKEDPNHLRAQVYYGVCFMGKNEFDRAIEELQKALKLDQNYPLTNYALAVSYARKAQPEPAKAEEYLAAAKKNGYQVPVWFEQYVSRLKSGNVSPAEQKPS